MRKVVHFEIPADDLDRAKSFYSSVFGWDLSTDADARRRRVHLGRDHGGRRADA